MKKESADEIDISLEAVAGMEQMLNDLLDYFRLDNGKETIIAKPFTVKGLGTRLASEFAGLAGPGSGGCRFYPGASARRPGLPDC